MEILSKHRIAIADLLQKELSAEVLAMLQDAVNEGYSFADVIAMLDESGYTVAIHPVQEMDAADAEMADNEYEPPLSPRQQVMYDAYETIAETFGLWDETTKADGAHYIPAAKNVFAAEGIACKNCVFYEGGGGCELLSMQVEPEAACKLWVIPENLIVGTETQKAEVPATFNPPKGVQEAAQRARQWIADGHAGDGFTAVGRARAVQLAEGRPVSLETVRRMYSYFIRHENDSKAEGYSAGEKGYPSAGRVAWDAWGGDAGRSWVNGLYERYDLAKARGKHGMHQFIEADTEKRQCSVCGQKSDNWRHKIFNEGAYSVISKEVGEKRFTLAPMYVPDTLDAHGEWTDPDELQQAVWDYVKGGDRRIRLQHNRDIVAGEWVECMQIPYPMNVPMYKADGSIQEMTYPAGTVFLGVIWEPWAWELVKEGKVSGYSIGGRTERVMADMPEGA